MLTTVFMVSKSAHNMCHESRKRINHIAFNGMIIKTMQQDIKKVSTHRVMLTICQEIPFKLALIGNKTSNVLYDSKFVNQCPRLLGELWNMRLIGCDYGTRTNNVAKLLFHSLVETTGLWIIHPKS